MKMHSNGLLHLCSETIQAAWIDYNGHMNVAYYVSVFDTGTEALLDYSGLDADYRERTQSSTYVLETHVNYERELVVDAPVEIDLQLLDHDSKRIHYAMFMRHRDEGFQAACCEIMLMHMDMRSTRSAPMPESACARLAGLAAAQADLPLPPSAGSVIGIRRKS